MKFSKLINSLFVLASAYIANAQDFCEKENHEGLKINELSYNEEGISSTFNGIDYHFHNNGGHVNATVYSDNSFTCDYEKATSIFCSIGTKFNNEQTLGENDHIYADFNIIKRFSSLTDYSAIGVYGSTSDSSVKFFIIDNWIKFNPSTPEDANIYEMDGATYAAFIGKQGYYFSIRKEARDCGTIDITAHIEQWEKFGMKLGNINDVYVYVKASRTPLPYLTGSIDFSYAKVYVDTTKPSTNNCSSAILNQGYKCCSSTCRIAFTDKAGTWGYEDGEWCGCERTRSNCSSKILAQGYQCCYDNCEAFYTDKDGDWGYENGEWCGCN